jgi:exonuclease SbcC
MTAESAEAKTRQESLDEKKQEKEKIKNVLSKSTEKRSQLYGTKNPDNEEARFKNTIAEAEKEERKQAEIDKALEKNLMNAKAELTALNSSLKTLSPKLKALEKEFKKNMQEENFMDEKDFLKARLSSKEQSILTEKLSSLNQMETEIKARLNDRKSKIDIERSKDRTQESIENLQKARADFENRNQELNRELTEVKLKLAENFSSRNRLQEKQSFIQKQQKECERWNMLHSLIGSENGKKFRNFAQGLTFEIMVSHANNELKKMSDRYLLVRDNSSPLDLNVLDNYQAGEIRSVKNLSGGESFIVSLTLALGLSKMASHKVKVDSLFLDEGFGTLDEDSLETALETLATLNQEGKLIGIISHVAALKERIGTQISVSPISGGKSVIKGPGCRKK